MVGWQGSLPLPRAGRPEASRPLTARTATPSGQRVAGRHRTLESPLKIRRYAGGALKANRTFARATPGRQAMKRLQDKVIIVTGASSGLGAAAARCLAAEGAKVVIAARRRDRGEAVLSQIRADGGDGLFVQTDVTRTADVEALVAAAVAHFGGLDGAFNNAGVTGPALTPVADIPEEGWDEAINTNLRAVFVCMKHQIPALLARGGGAIVNMASMYGLVPSDVGHAAYCASKYGVIGLTKTAAIDYGDQGLRINAICPGFTHSEMVDPYVEADPKFMRRVISRHSSMNRLGEADEIGKAVAWLLSGEASFVNGEAMMIGGGEGTRLY
jgi:NAD(P)-dependent dehydrogenase (short-subunit alcohol dehydrogenase family)